MSRIPKLHTWAGVACLAIALVAVGNAAAQQQDEKDQSTQSDENPSDQKQSTESKSDDENQQSQDQQNQSKRSDDQQSTSSDSQSDQKAGQQRSQQRQQAQPQRRQAQQRLQRQGQAIRRQQSTGRDQQLQSGSQQGRNQSSWGDNQSSSWNDANAQDRQWPQPNGREYGSDSLRFRSGEQTGGDEQAGLGVQVTSDGRNGVVVSHIHPGSPAEEMGIRERDRITQVNGREVQSVQQFIARIRNMEPGQQVELDIRRAAGGGERTVRGELETRDEALAQDDNQGQSWSDSQGNQYGSESDRYSSQDGQYGNRGSQTSYEDSRSDYHSQPSRSGQMWQSGQMSSARIQQIERQLDRLRREIDELRASLQGSRSQSGERTAQYDEYPSQRTRGQGQTQSWESDSNQFRDGQRRGQSGQSNSTNRTSGTSQQGGATQDAHSDGPGGEVGDDRQSVGSDDINRRD